MEHKTAASIDGAYLAKLWNDFQIIIYSYHAEKALGLPIKGVIYNVLAKAKLQQRRGETEDAFEERRAVLIARSKTGRTSAKRKLPESDDEFQSRLTDKYLTDPAMFHREELLVSREQFRELEHELWQLTQAYEEAARRRFFIPNRASCYTYGRPCAYLPLCRSGGSQAVADNLFVRCEPHEELAPPKPVF